MQQQPIFRTQAEVVNMWNDRCKQGRFPFDGIADEAMQGIKGTRILYVF